MLVYTGQMSSWFADMLRSAPMEISLRVDETSSLDVSFDDLVEFVSRYDLIFARLYMRPPSGNSAGHLNGFFAAREWFNIVLSFAEALPDDKFLNHPIRSLIAESKPLQLKTALQVGFLTPDTMFTNNPSTMREFIAGAEGPCIVKPVDNSITANPNDPTQTLILFTQEAALESVAQTDNYQATSPVILQKKVEKDHELRVVVYGEQFRIIKIDSQRDERTRLDFRRRLADPSMYTLGRDDFDVGSKCLAYCRALGLDSGVFDLAVRPDGQPVFFECNPNGQWGAMNASAGGDIHQMAADYVADRICRG